MYGDDVPSSTWYRQDPSLPAEQRYYGGTPPEIIHMGAAWPNADFRLIEKNTEIAPGIHLIALVSDQPGRVTALVSLPSPHSRRHMETILFMLGLARLWKWLRRPGRYLKRCTSQA